MRQQTAVLALSITMQEQVVDTEVPDARLSTPAELETVIATTYDESRRLEAIDRLAALDTAEAAEALRQAYSRSTWRPTQLHLIRALARMHCFQARVFTFNLIRDGSDLTAAVESITTLSQNPTAVAGSFLHALIADRRAPLRRDAIAAIGSMLLFPCSELLLRVVEQASDNLVSEEQGQRAALALAKHGVAEVWPFLLASLSDPKCPEGVAARFLVAAAHLDPAQALLDFEHLRFSSAWLSDLKNIVEVKLKAAEQNLIEDALAQVFAANDPHTQRLAVARLAAYPLADVEVTVGILRHHGVAELECLLRSKIATAKSLKDDIEFIVTYESHISADALAFLCMAHIQCGRRAILGHLHERCLPATRIALIANLYDRHAATHLRGLATQDLPIAQLESLLEAAVLQSFLAPPDGHAEEYRNSCGGFLERALADQRFVSLRDRIIEAIGALRWENTALLRRLLLIVQNTPGSRAAYEALSNMQSPQARELVLQEVTKRADTILSSTDENLLACLAAHSQHQQHPVDALHAITTPQTYLARLSVLKMLATTRSPRHDDLIINGLMNGNYETRMLAIAASRSNMNERTAKALLPFVHCENEAVAHNTVNSLCSGNDVTAHTALVESIAELEPVVALEALRRLNVRVGEDYRAILVKIGDMLRQPQGAWQDREVMAASQRLRRIIEGNMNRNMVQAPTANCNVSEIENFLEAHCVGYRAYSDTIKSVLMNAELTYQNPTIFNWRVDKSTLVVEYVKAIDIFLQEAVGPDLLETDDRQVLAAMQARIIQLQTDNELVAPLRRIRDLDCGSQFSISTLPTNKLLALSKAILSGTICQEPYRIIDGLRAWSVVLLLFGRTFVSQGVQIVPLISMQRSDNEVICEVASLMSTLQEQRNQAAHRGTMRQYNDLDAIRRRSIDILNTLYLVFGAPRAVRI